MSHQFFWFWHQNNTNTKKKFSSPLLGFIFSLSSLVSCRRFALLSSPMHQAQSFYHRHHLHQVVFEHSSPHELGALLYDSVGRSCYTECFSLRANSVLFHEHYNVLPSGPARNAGLSPRSSPHPLHGTPRYLECTVSLCVFPLWSVITISHGNAFTGGGGRLTKILVKDVKPKSSLRLPEF